VILYRAPVEGGTDSTVAATDLLTTANLSDSQRRVLLALCRPFKDSNTFATPATNQQIAEELYLSVDAVKTHLRALFAKFGRGPASEPQACGAGRTRATERPDLRARAV
jgi:predicted ArsR family transcriptional regulator